MSKRSPRQIIEDQNRLYTFVLNVMQWLDPPFRAIERSAVGVQWSPAWPEYECEEHCLYLGISRDDAYLIGAGFDTMHITAQKLRQMNPIQTMNLMQSWRAKIDETLKSRKSPELGPEFYADSSYS